MPVATRKPKPHPAAVYVCTTTASFGPTVLNAGERRRGDDPLVTEYPQHWVQDGVPIVPEVAVPEVISKARGRKRPVERDTVVYGTLEPFDGVVLRRPLKVANAAGEITQLAVGAIFARDSELVRLLPDAFERATVRR